MREIQPATSFVAVMFTLSVRSGIVDAAAEGAIILVTVLLSAGSLERIRGLCLEHKLRRGKVVSLRRRTLTFPETFASLLFVVGLPIATLLTSIGRNGKSEPIYKTVSAVVDVWHTDLSTPAFHRDASGARAEYLYAGFNSPDSRPALNAVTMCGTGESNLTMQAATGTAEGKVKCGGSFNVSDENYATLGFVHPKGRWEKMPSEVNTILPPQLYVKRAGDWRSQCIEEVRGFEICYAWKWTQKEISVCDIHQDQPTEDCQFFTLGPDAPLVDSDKAARKIEATLWQRGSFWDMETAHLMVSTTKDLMIKTRSGDKQVTAVELSSAAGLISVLTVSILIWIISWLAAHIATRRHGYSLRLHTYSGLSAYIVSLEDKYNTAAGGRCTECSSYSAVDAVEGSELGAETEDESHPCMRLRPGEGHFPGVLSFSGSRELPGARVKKGRIASGLPRTTLASVDSMY